jgi:hypothetical protein
MAIKNNQLSKKWADFIKKVLQGCCPSPDHAQFKDKYFSMELGIESKHKLKKYIP